MSFASRPLAAAVLTIGLVTVAGCGKELGPDKKVATIDISPKSARLYSVGQSVMFTTDLTTEAGTPGTGIEVVFTARDETLIGVTSGGVATAKKKGGSTWIIATAGGKSDSAIVEVPATSCGSTPRTIVEAGQVIAGVAASGFCAASSTGEYAVIVHNTSLASTGTSSIEITAVAVANPEGTEGSFSRAVHRRSALAPSVPRRDVALEMRHRQSEAALMASFAAPARGSYAKRSTRASAAPTVGETMRINVSLTGPACTDSVNVDARVAAVSTTAIVLHDPRNPPGGFTDAEYGEFAQIFDDHIHPLAATTFGAPTDLDNNQRTLIVFTRSVNQMIPLGSTSYIGGVTFARDLLLRTGGPSACPASNQAEMIYMLAPDPEATINNNPFSKSFVQLVGEATLVHEYEHVINTGRRRFLNASSAQPLEETWLSEGLAHMAEELLFYSRTGRPSRSNYGGGDITDDHEWAQFLVWAVGNYFLYDEYVFAPTRTSPFEAGDELATRGATWAFLRYLADQSPSDGMIWYNLVNSGETGLTNVQNRFGTDAAGLRTRFRDFVISLFTDDFVSGVAAKYTQPSWDMRSIYAPYRQFSGQSLAWPLPGVGLRDVETKSANLQAGGFQVYRFKGIAGTDSHIRVTGAAGTALPAGITVSVVRVTP